MRLSLLLNAPAATTAKKAGDSPSSCRSDGVCTKGSEQQPLPLRLGVICLVMSLMLFWLSYTVADPDLWGHLKFGQDIWQSGRIISQDTYSYLTGEQPWINHEWLAEVIFARLYAFGGSPALVVFKTTMALLIVALLYRRLGRQGLSLPRGGMVVGLVALVLFPGTGTLRPQIFTYLLFLATLLILDEADRGRPRWLWALPPVFALWVNLHGGFLAGMGIVIGWTVTRMAVSIFGAWRDGSRIGRLEIAFVASAIAAGLATLVNPYGMGMLEFLVKPATFARPDISEWQPMQIMSKYGLVFYLPFLTLGLVGILGSKRARRPAPLAMFICLAILPLLAYRHGPLFGAGMLVVAGEHIADAWNRWVPPRGPGRWLRGAGRPTALAAAALALLSVAPVRLSLSHFRCIGINPTASAYPVRAAAILREGGATGNLAVLFEWGEYAIWHLSPRIKVSVDGRRETVYSDRVLAENLSFARGVGDWSRIIREYETDMALVERTRPAYNLLKLYPGWVLVHEDTLSAVFARADSPLVHQIRNVNLDQVPADGAGSCFP